MSSKTFTHLWLDDKGLKAVKKPFHIFSDSPNEETSKMYQQALQQALDEGVYFKDNDHNVVAVMEYTIEAAMVKFKPYPVPDGYEVRVEEDVRHPLYGSELPECEYAILVPKEKGLPSWVTDDSGPEKESKQQSIEEAANQSIETLFFMVHLNAQQGESFKSYFEREKMLDRVKEIAGAKSRDVEIEELKAIIKRRCDRIAQQDKELVVLMKRIEKLEMRAQ
jgi:hypothetical protein